LQQFKDIWESPLQYVGGIAQDVAKYAILEWIPVVNVIANIYLLGGAALDVLGSLADLASAEQEARDAKTAVALQRAAAHMALALSSTARKVVDAAAAYAATKAKGKIVETAKGAGAGPERESAPPDEDRAKVAEKNRPDEAASEAEVAVRQASAPELRNEAAILQEEVKTPENIENVLDPELAKNYDYKVAVRGTEHTYYHRPKRGWCRASGRPICGYAFGPEVEEALETARQARRPSVAGIESQRVAEQFFGSRFQRQVRFFEGRVLGLGERTKYGTSIADVATTEGRRIVVEVKNIDIAANLRTQFADLSEQVAKYLTNVIAKGDPNPEKTKFWVWLDIRGQRLPPGGLQQIVESVSEGSGHVIDEVYLHTEVGTLVYKTL
jgi:hypothetical protein